MELMPGMQLFVNNKFYFDVKKIDGDNAKIRIKYSETAKKDFYLYKTITLPVSLFKDIQEYGFLYTCNINEKDLKFKIGSLIDRIAVEQDIIKIMNENVAIINEDYPASFDMETFKSLKTFKDRIEYCNKHLEKLGSGSSRTVFKIDENKCLKLAKNAKGIAQNETEITWGNDYYFKNILCWAFDSHPDGLWVEMELARKVKPSEFKNIVGFDVYTVGMYLMNFYNENNGKISYNNIDPKIKEQLAENEFVSKICDFVLSSDIHVGDFKRISSYGIVKRDGQEELVIIDYGLSHDTLKKHYTRKKVYEEAGMGAVSNPGLSGTPGVPGTAGSGDISNSVLPSNSYGFEVLPPQNFKTNRKIRKIKKKGNKEAPAAKKRIIKLKENIDIKSEDTMLNTSNDFKTKLFDFLDYPTNNDNDIKLISLINNYRAEFLNISDQRIKQYLKTFYEKNRKFINNCSEWFQNSISVLGDI